MTTTERLGFGPVANARAMAISVAEPEPSSSAPLLMASPVSKRAASAAGGAAGGGVPAAGFTGVLPDAFTAASATSLRVRQPDGPGSVPMPAGE